MPYLYSIKINTDAKEDVNQRFREARLAGEVIVDEQGGVYICPQISASSWHILPMSEHPEAQVDGRWCAAIEATLAYMESRYSVTVMNPEPTWLYIGKVFRCPKMVVALKDKNGISL